MLVRARPKRIEDLPEWAKCCDVARANLVRNGARFSDGFTVDVAKQDFYPHKQCQFCGADLPKIKAVQVVGGEADGLWSALAWIDLDEGPLEAA